MHGATMKIDHFVFVRCVDVVIPLTKHFRTLQLNIFVKLIRLPDKHPPVPDTYDPLMHLAL